MLELCKLQVPCFSIHTILFCTTGEVILQYLRRLLEVAVHGLNSISATFRSGYNVTTVAMPVNGAEEEKRICRLTGAYAVVLCAIRHLGLVVIIFLLRFYILLKEPWLSQLRTILTEVIERTTFWRIILSIFNAFCRWDIKLVQILGIKFK